MGECHPHASLCVEGCLCDVAAVWRHLVVVPRIGERKPLRAESERGEKAVQEPLRLVPVGRPRRPAQTPAVDAYSHRPASAFLALEVACSFFPGHCIFLSFGGLGKGWPGCALLVGVFLELNFEKQQLVARRDPLWEMKREYTV